MSVEDRIDCKRILDFILYVFFVEGRRFRYIVHNGALHSSYWVTIEVSTFS